MTNDAKRVEYLLRTMAVWMPAAKISLRRQESGEVPSLALVCDACQGKGLVGKRVKRPCARCEGHGRVIVDAYTEREVSTREKPVQRVERVSCDACQRQGVHRNGRRCRWCEGTGQRILERSLDTELERLEGLEQIRQGREAPERFETWQREKQWLYRQGSYRELEEALLLLRVSHASLVRTLERVLVYEEPVYVSAPLRDLVDEGCERLARLMPTPIRVPRWAQTQQSNGKGRWANGNAQGHRNEEIRRLRSEGMSLTKIGQRVGLSKQAVQVVLRKAS